MSVSNEVVSVSNEGARGDIVVAALEEQRRIVKRTIATMTLVVSMVISFTSAPVALLVWTW